MRAKNPKITGLYYITHKDNVPSILEHGIMSHEEIEKQGIRFTPIYDKEIVSRRQSIVVPNGKSLWHHANLFFQPRNAMLYRVLCESGTLNDIVVIAVKPEVVDRLDIYITDGNAAHSQTTFYSAGDGRKKIGTILKEAQIEYWNEEDGSKRKVMAEVLVPRLVEPNMIADIYVATPETKKKLDSTIDSSVNVIPEPYWFFQPNYKKQLTSHISLIQGDLFFSKMQTLTISINTRGIMGKGLASRAKYQFPRVYVYYQDLCKSGKLKMGRPQLYKTEISVAHELADEPDRLTNCTENKYFLLFPTKHHWREDSDISGIEEGLRWLLDNYKREGISSLAIPALGCGLGNLSWKDVGPLMVTYLEKMDIQVSIYLPAEKTVSEEWFNTDFLVRR